MRIALALVLIAASIGGSPKSAETICVGEHVATLPGPECSTVIPLSVAAENVDRPYVRWQDGTLTLGTFGKDKSLVEADARVLVSVEPPRVVIDPSRSLDQLTLEFRKAGGTHSWIVTLKADELKRLHAIRLSTGDYELKAVSPGFAPLSFKSTIGGKRPRLGEIHLVALPRISGTVVDSKTGAGLIGTRILDPDQRVIALVAAVDGSFSVDVPVKDWPKSIGIAYPGRGTRWLPVPSRVADVSLGNISLPIAGAITVRLPENVAVAQVRVLQVQSDERARVERFRAAPRNPGEEDLTFSDVAPGEYEVVVEGAGPLERFMSKVSVRPEETVVVSVGVDPIDLIIRVQDERAPIPSAALEVQHSTGQWRSRLKLDDNGEFRGRLWQAGTLAAYVEVPNRTTPYFAKKSVDNGATVEWNITVGGQRIRVKVVDAYSGTSISGARATLRSDYSDGASTRILSTQSDGVAEFDYVKSGNHLLTVKTDDYLETSESFQTLPSEAERSLVVRLSKGVERTIRITNQSGVPCVGAAVGPPFGSARTGADGTVTLMVASDRRDFLFVVPREGSFAPIAIDPSMSTDVIDVVVPSASATISIRTVSEGGEAIPGVGLLVRFNGLMLPIDVLRELYQMQGLLFKTDPGGVTTLKGMPTGLYEFWPIFDYSEIERLQASPGPSAAMLAVQAGDNLVELSFRKVGH